MVEKLRMFGKLQDIITKFNEPSRAFWAQCCGNSQGRFLMIAQYRERGRKEVVMVPEGVNGEGWASVLHILQVVIDSFVTGDKVKHQTNE